MEQKNPESDTTFKLIESGLQYLVTSNEWFYGPDGQQYRAVYGRCWIIEAERTMGFRPTRSTNWYLLIRGSLESEMVMPGDMVGPAIRLSKMPTIREGNAYDGKVTTPLNSILILK